MRGKVSQRANKLLNETKIEKCILGKQLKTIKYPAKMSTNIAFKLTRLASIQI